LFGGKKTNPIAGKTADAGEVVCFMQQCSAVLRGGFCVVSGLCFLAASGCAARIALVRDTAYYRINYIVPAARRRCSREFEI